MKKCSDCNNVMRELTAKTPDGVGYNYFKCSNCGEEILNMSQLHKVAEKYRAIKRFNARLSRWGLSLGLRIPKELVKRYRLKSNKNVTIIPEKEAIRITP